MTQATTHRLIRTWLLTALLAAGALAAISLIAAERAAAQEVATVNEVAADYAAPALSSLPHADGVQVRWGFNEDTTTPPGWSLTGFALHRKIGDDIVVLSETIPTADRSLKDPLDMVADEQRYPGAQISYTIRAKYVRISDGYNLGGRWSPAHVFEAPQMPGVNNAGNQFWEYERYGQMWVVNQLTWALPHLAWDRSAGFDSIDAVIIHSKNHNVILAGDATWTQISSTQPANPGDCVYTFTIRTQFGLFFSNAVTVDGGGIMC